MIPGKHLITIAVLAIGAIAVLSSAFGEAAPELQLESCTIELVDGATLKGELATQFDMPDHLIVYSPRLATVRSILKEHVHALTVDGKRRQLNEKRESTESEHELLNFVDWPDAPPKEGFKPAYTTENWEKPRRLLVWAKPGKSGRFGEPGNWLMNGRPAISLGSTEVWSGPSWLRDRGVTALDKDTDILIPASVRDYQIRGRRSSYLARHITVESNAFFGNGIKGVYGNIWVVPSGQLDGGGHASMRGTKHTFFVNGARREAGHPVDWKTIDAKRFASKWILRKDDPEASMEFIGGIGSGDETHIVRGHGIISENSSVLIGPRCCQSVRPDGTLQLCSGAVLAKSSNQLHKQDMLVAGTVLAGSPDRPLQSDCYIGISFKDHEAVFAIKMWQHVGKTRGFIGFEVVPGGTMRVYSADPKEARLVFACHRKEGAGDSGDVPAKEQKPDQWRIYENLPRRINMVIWEGADMDLNGVVFQDIEKHGIKLQDMSMKDTWRNVFYGENNAAPPDELYVQHTPTLENRGAYSYPIETVLQGRDVGGDTVFARTAGTPVFQTADGWYTKGKSVEVNLTSENQELDIRYTLDGAEPTAESPLYDGSLAVQEDVLVKAASFDGDEKQGEMAEAAYRFIAPKAVEMLPARVEGGAQAGLEYAYYEGAWEELPEFEELTPARRGVATNLGLESVEHRGDKFAVVYDGYIKVLETGVYNMYLSTARGDACQVFIDGKRVIDSDLETMEEIELVGIESGHHPLRVAFFDRGWGQYVRVALRRLDEKEKQTVRADMLTY